MNSKYLAKGILYIALGVGFTPAVLMRYPAMMVIQGFLLTGLGLRYVFKACSTSHQETKP